MSFMTTKQLQRLLADHPVKLELRFKSDEDRDAFGRYLDDGGGEQRIKCYGDEWDGDRTWMTIRVEEL